MSNGNEKQATCAACGQALATVGPSADSLCVPCRQKERDDDYVDSLIEDIKPANMLGSGVKANRQETDSDAKSAEVEAGLPSSNGDEPESWQLRCRICDSVLWVNEQQIGEEIRCNDCHSLITVQRSGKKRTRKSRRQPPPQKVKQADMQDLIDEIDDDFDDLTLSPPEELDDDLKALRREAVLMDDLASVPHELEPPVADPFHDKGGESHESDGDEDEMIELIDIPPEVANQRRKLADSNPVVLPRMPRKKKTPDPIKVVGSEGLADDHDAPVRVYAKRKKKSGQQKSRDEKLHRISDEVAPGDRFRLSDSTFSSAGNQLVEMLNSPGVFVWGGAAIVAMWVGNTFWYTAGPQSLAEDSHAMRWWVAWGGGMIVGRAPFWIGYILLLFAGSTIFRAAAEGKTKVESFRALDLANFLKTVLLFGFSMLVATLPWIFTGLMLLTLPLQFLVAGVFLASSWYNQSPFAILSAKSLAMFSQSREATAAWKLWAKLLVIPLAGGLLGGLLMDFSFGGISIFTSLIGAVIVTVVTLVYAANTGWMSGEVAESLRENG